MSIFLTVALLHLFAVASPGPDFVLVSRQSFRYGRTVAIWTSVGIAIGILFHVALSLTGLSLLLQNQPYLFWYLKLAAALYIGYLGLASLILTSPTAFFFVESFIIHVLKPKPQPISNKLLGGLTSR